MDYDHLITTIPLDQLCDQVVLGEFPEEIKQATRQLRHSRGYMVGIGIRQKCPSTRSWMYFPENNCPFYRVSYASNLSPRMTPDNERYYSLLCETSDSEFKPVNADTIVEDTICGLINASVLSERDKDDIVDTWCYCVQYSYPIPTLDRDSVLASAIPYLEGYSIYSRGRFGMWKYEVSNTDHSLMQGVELVNRLLLHEPETTIGFRNPSSAEATAGAIAASTCNRSTENRPVCKCPERGEPAATTCLPPNGGGADRQFRDSERWTKLRLLSHLPWHRRYAAS